MRVRIRRSLLVGIGLSLWLAQPLMAQRDLLLLGVGSGGSSATVARVFNGTSDLADNTTAYLSGATAFTICTWFKPNTLAGAQNSYFIQAQQNGGNGWALLWDFLTDN